MVLDAKATPFSRIWCAFEQATAVTMDEADRGGKGHLLLDIATVPTGRSQIPPGNSDSSCSAQLLTTGLSPAEERMEAFLQEDGFGESGWLAKSKREEGFPIGVVREALLEISVVDAEASKPQDKTNILNSITGRDAKELDLAPPETHPKYDEVDRTLKSIFAEAAMRKAVAEGLSLTALKKALRKGTARKELRFVFSKLENFGAAELKCVSQSLPETLQSLTAAFDGCAKLADVAALGAGLEKLQALTSLNLNFGRSPKSDLIPSTWWRVVTDRWWTW